MRSPGAGAAAVAGLLAVLCVAPAAARYAVGDIKVVLGNPVRGVENGVVLRRHFVPPHCRLEPTDPRVAPLSGSLEHTVIVEVGIIACPPDLPAPRVRCDWKIAGDAGQGDPARGWRYAFQVPMPVRTGVYRLAVSCTIDGGAPETFAPVTFVTYAPPLASVSPPRAEWYRRACTWGAGLTASASEHRVIRAIQRGLFAHGQRSWRYGYCEVEGEICVFGDIAVPTGDPDLKCCLGFCFPGRCGCEWPAMVDPKSGCHFSDCFVFSDVLRYISATMGIGGFIPREVLGLHGRGFATHAEFRSLDPAFAGNLLCGPRTLPCNYLFDNHSLLERERLFYDATFGQVYLDEAAVYGRNVCRQIGNDDLFDDELTLAQFLERGYGVFAFYDTVSLTEPLTCDLSDRSFNSEEFAFTGEVTAFFVDSGTELTPVLAVDVEVEVRRRGDYLLLGGILAGDRLITRLAIDDFVNVPSETRVRAPGRHLARLYFSTRELLEVADAEDLRLRVQAFEVGDRPDAPVAVLVTGLPAAGPTLPRRAAPVDAGEIRASGVDDDGDGLFEALRVEVDVDVGVAGTYAVDARLASGGETVAYAGQRLELRQGSDRLTLDFTGAAIARAGLDGPYEVTVELHQLEPPRLVRFVTAEIGAWPAARFE